MHLSKQIPDDAVSHHCFGHSITFTYFLQQLSQ